VDLFTPIENEKVVGCCEFGDWNATECNYGGENKYLFLFDMVYFTPTVPPVYYTRTLTFATHGLMLINEFGELNSVDSIEWQ